MMDERYIGGIAPKMSGKGMTFYMRDHIEDILEDELGFKFEQPEWRIIVKSGSTGLSISVESTERRPVYQGFSISYNVIRDFVEMDGNVVLLIEHYELNRITSSLVGEIQDVDPHKILSQINTTCGRLITPDLIIGEYK